MCSVFGARLTSAVEADDDSGSETAAFSIEQRLDRLWTQSRNAPPRARKPTEESYAGVLDEVPVTRSLSGGRPSGRGPSNNPLAKKARRRVVTQKKIQTVDGGAIQKLKQQKGHGGDPAIQRIIDEMRHNTTVLSPHLQEVAEEHEYESCARLRPFSPSQQKTTLQQAKAVAEVNANDHEEHEEHEDSDSSGLGIDSDLDEPEDFRSSVGVTAAKAPSLSASNGSKLSFELADESEDEGDDDDDDEEEEDRPQPPPPQQQPPQQQPQLEQLEQKAPLPQVQQKPLSPQAEQKPLPPQQRQKPALQQPAPAPLTAPAPRKAAPAQASSRSSSIDLGGLRTTASAGNAAPQPRKIQSVPQLPPPSSRGSKRIRSPTSSSVSEASSSISPSGSTPSCTKKPRARESVWKEAVRLKRIADRMPKRDALSEDWLQQREMYMNAGLLFMEAAEAQRSPEMFSSTAQFFTGIAQQYRNAGCLYMASIGYECCAVALYHGFMAQRAKMQRHMNVLGGLVKQHERRQRTSPSSERDANSQPSPSTATVTSQNNSDSLVVDAKGQASLSSFMRGCKSMLDYLDFWDKARSLRPAPDRLAEHKLSVLKHIQDVDVDEFIPHVRLALSHQYIGC